MPVVRHTDRPLVHRAAPLPGLQRLVDRAAGSESVTVLVNALAPGDAIPAHVHDVEEVLVVVDGSCAVDVAGETIVAAAGDAVIVPPGTRHAVGHHGAGPARLVAVLASPDVHIP